MSSKEFTVKNENVHAFITSMMYDQELVRRVRNDVSGYHLMRDEIVIQKENTHNLVAGDYVIIQIETPSLGISFNCYHKYKYQIIQYDDVSLKMILVDFKVETFKKISTVVFED